MVRKLGALASQEAYYKFAKHNWQLMSSRRRSRISFARSYSRQSLRLLIGIKAWLPSLEEAKIGLDFEVLSFLPRAAIALPGASSMLASPEANLASPKADLVSLETKVGKRPSGLIVALRHYFLNNGESSFPAESPSCFPLILVKDYRVGKPLQKCRKRNYKCQNLQNPSTELFLGRCVDGSLVGLTTLSRLPREQQF